VFDKDNTHTRAVEALMHYLTEENKLNEALELTQEYANAIKVKEDEGTIQYQQKMAGISVLVQRGLLLFKMGKYEEFIDLCLPILRRKDMLFYRSRSVRAID